MEFEVEERISTLESVLGAFIVQTNKSLTRLERDTEAFREEMKEFKNEMKEFKNEMKEFKDEMKEFKDEMGEFKTWAKRSIEDNNRRWGHLSNKLGTMVEDLVAPSLPRIVKECSGFNVEKILIGASGYLPDGSEKEYDAIVIAGGKVFLNSTKATFKTRYVDEFIEDIAEFSRFFPEYSGKPIIGITAALRMDTGVKNYAEKQGFWVLGVGEQLMEIQNSEGFVPIER